MGEASPDNVEIVYATQISGAPASELPSFRPRRSTGLLVKGRFIDSFHGYAECRFDAAPW